MPVSAALNDHQCRAWRHCGHRSAALSGPLMAGNRPLLPDLELARASPDQDHSAQAVSVHYHDWVMISLTPVALTLKHSSQQCAAAYVLDVEAAPTSLTGADLSANIHLSRRCLEVYMERQGLLNEKKARQRLRQGIKESGRIEIQPPNWLRKTRFTDNIFLIIGDEIALPLMPPKEPATPVRGQTRPWVAVTCLVRNQRPEPHKAPQREFVVTKSAPRPQSAMMLAFQQALRNLTGPQLLTHLDIADSAVGDYAAITETGTDQARQALETALAQSALSDQRPEWVLRQPLVASGWIELDPTTAVPLENGIGQGLYRVTRVLSRELQLPQLNGVSGIELAELVGFAESVRQEYAARLQQPLNGNDTTRRLSDIVAKQGQLDLAAPDWADGQGDFWIILGRSRAISGRVTPGERRPLQAEHLYQRPWESVDLSQLVGSELNEPLLVPKDTLRSYRTWRQVGEKKAPRQLREEIATSGRAVTERPEWINDSINADYYLLVNDGAFAVNLIANEFGRPWSVNTLYPAPVTVAI